MRAIAATLALSLLALPAVAQDAAAPAPAAPATTTTEAPATAAPTAAAPTTAPATSEATPATPAPTEGTLSVTSTPSGKLFIDDKDTGLVTPVVDHPVPAGTHTVKIVADDGRTQTAEFTMEAGGSLSLNIALPEPATPATTETKPEEKKPEEAKPAEAQKAPPADDWTWMTVTGWSGLGLGTIGLLSGAVVLTTPTDPQQGPLGFGLFGAGVGMVLGGAVLLYLDNELSESKPAEAVAPAR